MRNTAGESIRGCCWVEKFRVLVFRGLLFISARAHNFGKCIKAKGEGVCVLAPPPLLWVRRKMLC